MPRAKKLTLAVLLAQREELEQDLAAVQAAITLHEWQHSRQPGEKCIVQIGNGESKAGLIGAVKYDEEQKHSHYFVYVDRADGFGADGRAYRCDSIMPVPVQEGEPVLAS
jgi:hypothetical protein